MLFLPKILAALRVALNDPVGHGGRARLSLSLVGEVLLSALLAPIRMLFHTQFVVTALAGRTLRWKSPPRGDNETGWREAFARHGVHTLVGVVWAAIVWWLDPKYLWWVLPVVGALILSIPLSVLTSRAALGRALRRHRYFLIPEESEPPPVIQATQRHWRQAQDAADLAVAIVDPIVNALVCAQAVARPVNGWPREAIADALVERALHDGLAALSADDRNHLIADPPALSALHWAVWTAPDAHASWRMLTASAPARSHAHVPEPQLADATEADTVVAASHPAGG